MLVSEQLIPFHLDMDDWKSLPNCQPAIGCGQVLVELHHFGLCAYCQRLMCMILFNFIAMWLLPTNSTYGGWPRSGEIDLVESRGNRNYVNHEGKQIGVEHFGSTLHFGPAWNQNGYHTATYSSNGRNGNGYNKDFHKYELIWSPLAIQFLVDDREIGNVMVGDGFWARGKFNSSDNIWKNASLAAPFDKEVNIQICWNSI